MPAARSNDFIQSLERGLAVINSFTRERASQTLSEVAQQTGLTRATARRVLLTLAELGYVRQTSRDFSLTPKVLDLGYSYLSSFQVVELAQQPMERLVEAVRESSSISVLDGAEIVYVARVPTKRIMTIALAIGSRLPAYPTSMGRVLLAGLSEAELEAYTSRTEFEQLTERTITDRKAFRAAIDKVRADGYALVDQELEEGVRSIAAPIRNSRGSVIAAMNISCHASRVTVKRMREEFRPHLLEAAREITQAASVLPGY
ncbi:MAG TPA: IclR family transcriptional regulator C-terminal domain-containing protein [Acidimicrobiia bacterium]|nr:IclR family transcriptional regulator C-terminal domain-containing protein [Acidimicrobiia bacterium]